MRPVVGRVMSSGLTASVDTQVIHLLAGARPRDRVLEQLVVRLIGYDAAACPVARHNASCIWRVIDHSSMS